MRVADTSQYLFSNAKTFSLGEPVLSIADKVPCPMLHSDSGKPQEPATPRSQVKCSDTELKESSDKRVAPQGIKVNNDKPNRMSINIKRV